MSTPLPASTPAVVMTIAGSDSCAGAGIQADLKTLSAMGVYGTSAVTAITAQNTCAVDAAWPVPVEAVKAQIRCLMADLPASCIKIGMLGSGEIVEVVYESLQAFAAQVPLVLDPVMVSTSGARLLDAGAEQGLRQRLLPRAAVITPNLPEAAALLGCEVAADAEQMHRQAQALRQLGAAAVLIKGGHLPGSEALDMLVTATAVEVFKAPRSDSRNTHGTGCSLASAIAAGLARGQPLGAAVRAAKDFLTAAIAAAAQWQLGKGHGPVDHFYSYRAHRSHAGESNNSEGVL